MSALPAPPAHEITPRTRVIVKAVVGGFSGLLVLAGLAVIALAGLIGSAPTGPGKNQTERAQGTVTGVIPAESDPDAPDLFSYSCSLSYAFQAVDRTYHGTSSEYSESYCQYSEGTPVPVAFDPMGPDSNSLDISGADGAAFVGAVAGIVGAFPLLLGLGGFAFVIFWKRRRGAPAAVASPAGQTFYSGPAGLGGPQPQTGSRAGFTPQAQQTPQAQPTPQPQPAPQPTRQAQQTPQTQPAPQVLGGAPAWQAGLPPPVAAAPPWAGGAAAGAPTVPAKAPPAAARLMVGVTLFVMGAFFVGIPALIYAGVRPSASLSATTTGTVTSIREDEVDWDGEGSSISCRYSYEFEAAGENYSGTSSAGSSSYCRLAAGDSVEVRYDPDRPFDHASVESLGGMITFLAIFALVGCVLAGLGIAQAIRFFARRKRESVL